jgi:isoquinoline 1-oxidoreductase beta subunit
MGVKRRAFLIGGVAIVGGGIFALQYGDHAMRRDAAALSRREKAGSFGAWLHIGEDDPTYRHGHRQPLCAGANGRRRA